MKSKNIFNGATLIDNPPINFNFGRWYTIDPGDNTAICEWIDGKMTDLITIEKCLSNSPIIHIFSSSFVIIENVELWGGSSVSYTSAARGDLFKLAMVVGVLINNYKKCGCSIYLVSPRKWKGQLNQEQLQHILSEKFKFKARNEHEASAYGIGLWAAGMF
jgi:hypothetical protein